MKNKLFKIYNNYNTSRTEITLLGLKIKFINKKLIKMPDYSKALQKVQEKHKNNQKIRVGFYVSENAKWNGEELYKLFEQSQEFEPIVVVSLLDYVHNGDDVTRNNLEENYEFFKNAGKNVVKAYDDEKKEYIPLEDFDLDIIFYQQPWGIPEIHNIEYTKEFALNCHFHYGLHIFKSKITDIPFYRKLFVYFVNNENEKRDLQNKGYNNLFNIGYPKLDVYKLLKRTKLENNKKTIIYAPHFAYAKNSILRIGTFDKTGEKILNFAKKHPEYNWIFKPHPALKNQLIKDKKYGATFVEKYYSEWAKLGSTYEQGNYFELFVNSDLMITDCSSFLLEYLPSNSPVFRLERKDSVHLNDFGRELVKTLYKINNFKQFEKYFKNVVENDFDALKQVRIKFIKSVLGEEYNTKKILSIINKKLEE